VEDSANQAPPRRSLRAYVEDQPLSAIAIATAAGFVLGGGVNQRLGRAMLSVVGRVALRNVAASLIGGLINGTDTRTRDDGTHDDGRPTSDRVP